jgi:hypothetical protein
MLVGELMSPQSCLSVIGNEEVVAKFYLTLYVNR